MPDTQRDLTTLLGLFPDNTSGLIGAQDFRDFIVTAMGGYGGLHVDSTVGPQTITATPTLITLWDELYPADGAVVTGSTSTNNITVSLAGVYHVTSSLSFSLATAGNLTFTVFQNGAAANMPPMSVAIASAADVGGAHLSGLLTCAANDTIDLRASATPDEDIDFLSASLIVKRLQ